MAFPTLHAGGTAHYGTTRTKRTQTEVIQFGDDSEQRWQSGPALNEFSLELRNIDGVDLSAVRQFFIDQKGENGAAWSITIDGVEYLNCTFLTDVFPVEEPANTPERFDLTLPCRQTK
jgi:hypothetical protein